MAAGSPVRLNAGAAANRSNGRGRTRAHTPAWFRQACQSGDSWVTCSLKVARLPPAVATAALTIRFGTYLFDVLTHFSSHSENFHTAAPIIPTFPHHTSTCDLFATSGEKHSDHFPSYLIQNLVQFKMSVEKKRVCQKAQGP